MIKTAQELYTKQGISGFYRGIDSNIVRAMVLNGKVITQKLLFR